MVVPTLGRRQARECQEYRRHQAIDDNTLRNYSGKAVARCSKTRSSRFHTTGITKSGATGETAF
jgi:hypothetical protein